MNNSVNTGEAIDMNTNKQGAIEEMNNSKENAQSHVNTLLSAIFGYDYAKDQNSDIKIMNRFDHLDETIRHHKSTIEIFYDVLISCESSITLRTEVLINFFSMLERDIRLIEYTAQQIQGQT